MASITMALLESTKSTLGRPAKREIDSLAAHRCVMPGLERRYAVIPQPRRPAPNDDVTMLERHPNCLVRPLGSPEQENGGNTERHGNDGLQKVAFVLVLVQ